MTNPDTHSEREPRFERTHETFQEDHWSVLDIDGADNVFGPNINEVAGPEPVRIDIDGFVSTNTTDTLGNSGANVNTSIFLPLPEAVQLRDYLDDAIEDARNR